MKCLKCGKADGSWSVRWLAHSGERGLECPECGTVMTEAFIRSQFGIDVPIPEDVLRVPTHESPDQ